MASIEHEDPEVAAMRGVKVPSAAEYIGAVAGCIPFVIHYSSASSTTVNGVVTSSSYLDYVAVAGGATAVLFGLVSLALLGKTAPDKKQLRTMFGIGLLLLGIFQLVRGFGVLAM